MRTEKAPCTNGKFPPYRALLTVFYGLIDVRIALLHQLFIRPSLGADAAPVFTTGCLCLGEGAGIGGSTLEGTAVGVDMVFGAGFAPVDDLFFSGRSRHLGRTAGGTRRAAGHSAVGREGIGLAVDGLSTGDHCARPVKVVPVSVPFQPAGFHFTGAVEIIPGISDLFPACGHLAGAVQVIPAAVEAFPAGRHLTGVIQIVPATVDLLPAGAHMAVLIEPVPFIPVTDPFIAGLPSVVMVVRPGRGAAVMGLIVVPTGGYRGSQDRTGGDSGSHHREQFFPDIFHDQSLQ